MKNKIYILSTLILVLGFSLGLYYYNDFKVFAGILDVTNDCYSKGAATSTRDAYVYMATTTAATSTRPSCNFNKVEDGILEFSMAASSTNTLGANIIVEFSYNGGDWFQYSEAAAISAGAIAVTPAVHTFNHNGNVATTTVRIPLVSVPGRFVRIGTATRPGNLSDNFAYWWTLTKKEVQN